MRYSYLLSQTIELAQTALNSHHIQTNELAENAEDITNKPDERKRVMLQRGERPGENSNSVESTGRGCGRREERHREADERARRRRRRERRSTRPWRTSCRPPAQVE